MKSGMPELIACLRLISTENVAFLTACKAHTWTDFTINSSGYWWVQACEGVSKEKHTHVVYVGDYHVKLGYMCIDSIHPSSIEVETFIDGFRSIVLDTNDENGLEDPDTTTAEDLAYRINKLEHASSILDESSLRRKMTKESVISKAKPRESPSTKLTAICRVTISVFKANPRFCARNCHLMSRTESGALTCKTTDGRLDLEKPSELLPLRPKRSGSCRAIFGGAQ